MQIIKLGNERPKKVSIITPLSLAKKELTNDKVHVMLAQTIIMIILLTMGILLRVL